MRYFLFQKEICSADRTKSWLQRHCGMPCLQLQVRRVYHHILLWPVSHCNSRKTRAEAFLVESFARRQRCKHFEPVWRIQQAYAHANACLGERKTTWDNYGGISGDVDERVTRFTTSSSLAFNHHPSNRQNCSCSVYKQTSTSNTPCCENPVQFSMACTYLSNERSSYPSTGPLLNPSHRKPLRRHIWPMSLPVR